MSINRSAMTFGPVFVVLGAAYLLEDLGVWAVQVVYLLPVLLIIAGLALSVTSLVGDRR